MTFADTATAGNAIITINGGTNKGKGASLYLTASSMGGTSQGSVYGNGSFDISQHDLGGVTIGSLEGDGSVLLAPRRLIIGRANSTTTFAGSIQDGAKNTGGSLSKVGTGTLTLTGVNTYTGGTYVNAGAVIVANTTVAATGTGNLAVNGGTLGGSGIIASVVTRRDWGQQRCGGATGLWDKSENHSHDSGVAHLNSDATYSFALKSPKAQVIANGVTITSGAQFTMTAPKKKLRSGIKLTVINNTSRAPISGNFANLPDAGTITVGTNTFQANYEGGDGNDLTPTVR